MAIQVSEPWTTVADLNLFYNILSEVTIFICVASVESPNRSGEYYPIVFAPLFPDDVKHTKKQIGWSRNFNWSIYFKYPSVELYKLLVIGSDRIEGALSYLGTFN